MSKAILVMDMPELCADEKHPCPLLDASKWYYEHGQLRCGYTRAIIGISNCPLIPASGYLDEHGNLVSWRDEEDVENILGESQLCPVPKELTIKAEALTPPEEDESDE